MSYSRRTLLREGAILSFSALAASVLPGCRRRPKQFAGEPIRLFFGGSWLFCGPDAKSASMYAITRDMDATCGMGKTHRFPAGRWGEDFNRRAPDLQENGGSKPFVVSVADYTPSITRDQLFANAAANTSLPFRYFAAGQHAVNFHAPTVRIIELPVPSRLIPATIRQKATITGNAPFIGPTGPGVATMQIFEYDGATSWSFNGQTSANVSDHLHFHTVRLDDHASETHAPCMFKSLMTLISRGPHDLTLTIDPCEKSIKGSGAQQFSDEELQIEPFIPPDICAEKQKPRQPPPHPPHHRPTTRTVDLASCSGAGFGLGGDCGC